jgi:hypothetical protein
MLWLEGGGGECGGAMISKQLKLLFLMLTEFCSFQRKSGAVKSKGNQNEQKF